MSKMFLFYYKKMTKFWIKIKLSWKFHSIHFANNSIHYRWYPPPAVCYYCSVLLSWQKRRCKYSLTHFTQNQPGRYKQTAWQIWRAQTAPPSAGGRGQSSLASKQCPRAKNLFGYYTQIQNAMSEFDLDFYVLCKCFLELRHYGFKYFVCFAHYPIQSFMP